ncbi:DUF485 domain-containing protein [Saccharopolyspora erythraea]|uniref:DUF485 domain-containing protein n=1 Tax=Saccharopolyspora erythraea TaxID=1836 RepID=UPI001BA53432|nr:DUF485 domain-containing protein [Saccharopolyspora erythraea]QUH01814.1 DUF485 domain-containing protein [Saccharopolyspora erythraea]
MRRPSEQGRDRPTPRADVVAPEQMRALLRARRRFFVPAWAAFLTAAALFFGLAALAPQTFGIPIAPGMPLGVLLSVFYTALIFTLGYLYERRSAHWDERIADIRAAHREVAP